MSISLYDLLDVAPDASADEIRAAWRGAVADLDPTDRRFAVYNEAGGVLLDPERRAAYDAERAAEESASDDPASGQVERAAQEATTEHIAVEDGAGSAGVPDGPAGSGAGRPPAAAGAGVAGARRPGLTGRRVPAWVLAVLGLLLAGLVAASVYLVAAVPSDDAVAEASREAQGAAERAIVPVLSYDHRSLEADGEAAREWLTEDYGEEYDKLFAQITESAPETRTVVRTEVVASGLVRSGEDRVQVLVFVDRPTRNKSLEEPVVYKDQVRMTMEKVGDRWLVDQLCTTASCES